MMPSYVEFLHSLANSLEKEGVCIKTICPDLLEIIIKEMTLDDVLAYMVLYVLKDLMKGNNYET